jgi:hypothetical protein
MVAVALVFADEPCNASRFESAKASGGSAEEVAFFARERGWFDELQPD